MTNKTTTRAAIAVLGLGVVAAATFLYGFLVAETQAFPYWQIGAVLRRLAPPDEQELVDTTLLPVTISTFESTIVSGSKGRAGGGLAALDEVAIGVDRDGQFFTYRTPGVVTPLQLHVESNMEDLRAKGPAPEDPDDPDNDVLASFRFMDIAARVQADELHLFVSHHFWYPERQCKTTRVSRLVARDVDGLLSGAKVSDEWQTIFESEPCLQFSYRSNGPFQSPNNGGRLALDGAEGLFLSLGDHHLDGLSSPTKASQSDDNSYGKIIRIDLSTLDAQIHAKGLRNPQGLLVDRAGNLWETEHGPAGGDELNLIEENGNYGWPLTTFGTQYGRYIWDLNAVQGRHNSPKHRFEAPVFAWVPSIGISNLLQVDRFPEQWDGDLLVSSLAAQSLFRVHFQGDRVVFAEPIEIGKRIRDLVQMQNGTIVLWTDDRLLIEVKAAPEDSE